MGSWRWTGAPALAGALIIVTVLAAGPLRSIDATLQGYWAKKYTPNWASFLDSVPNAVAGQAVCLPVLLAIALVLAHRHRTWHPLAIVVAAEVAFYVGVGGMKVLLGRTSPAAGIGHFWEGGALEHGWYGIAYPSGHAAEAILFYGAAAYLLRTYAGSDVRIRKRLTFIVALITANATVVAFYLGFHWPTDLLGGLLAGALMLRIIVDADRRIAAGKPILGWHPPRMRTATTARSATAPAPVPVLVGTAPTRSPITRPTSPVTRPTLAPVASATTTSAPARPLPALARSAETATTQRAHDLPQLRPATVGADEVIPWVGPASAPFALRDQSRAHRPRARQLQTSGKS